MFPFPLTIFSCITAEYPFLGGRQQQLNNRRQEIHPNAQAGQQHPNKPAEHGRKEQRVGVQLRQQAVLQLQEERADEGSGRARQAPTQHREQPQPAVAVPVLEREQGIRVQAAVLADAVQVARQFGGRQAERAGEAEFRGRAGGEEAAENNEGEEFFCPREVYYSEANSAEEEERKIISRARGYRCIIITLWK